MSSDTPGRGHAARNLALLRQADEAGIDVDPAARREQVADTLEAHADELAELAADLPDGRADALGDAVAMVRGVAGAHREDDDDVRARLFGAGGEST